MLTGDKLETAISIGYSTKFLSQDMNLLIIDTVTEQETEQRINQYLGEIQGDIDHENSPINQKDVFFLLLRFIFLSSLSLKT